VGKEEEELTELVKRQSEGHCAAPPSSAHGLPRGGWLTSEGCGAREAAEQGSGSGGTEGA